MLYEVITVAGKSYNINNLADADWVIIPFTIEKGTFLVELKIKPQSNNNH